MIENDFYELFKTYEGTSELLKKYSSREILIYVANLVGISAEKLAEMPMGGYSKGKGSGAYLFVLQDLMENIQYYDKVYNLLADSISKEVFWRLIQFRIVPDIRFIEMACDSNNHQYFDKNIVSCGEDEVFVDCGGFTGDTTEDYIAMYKDYKRIYVYESADDNIATCRNNLSKYKKIVVRKGIVDSVQVISLDEDIKESVTFIKMDMEGLEIPAIIGAKNHIKNDNPKLAICTDHVVSDMWEIPLLIYEINPDYKLYFRHYNPNQNRQTVLYAIPQNEDSAKEIKKKRKKAVAFPYREGWSNVELTKDCGLIPFLLYKNHGFDVTMVSADWGEYTYLDTYVKGLKMEFLPTGSVEEKIKYLEKNSKDIDCLILRGAYDINIGYAIVYKQINPSGKIYVGLDANSGWMDRIIWDRPKFIAFMDCCDVIATSCKALQKHLNEKWPWKIEYIPNGYYDYGVPKLKPDFEAKENVILTVSRLGTSQKATDVLMEAFAMIADKIPDWKLRLVGSVEKEFEPYIEEYYNRYAKLRDRVQFVGSIADKNKLFDEYLKAKIFTLTSTYEGGTPNVVAEALTAGCVMAVTRFDAWEDAIDSGRCGMSAEINNVAEIADMLLQLCTTSDLKVFSENAYDYARRNYDMESIVSKLHEMLFGGGV